MRLALAAGDPRTVTRKRQRDPYQRIERFVLTGLRLASRLTEADTLQLIELAVPTVRLPSQGSLQDLLWRGQILSKAVWFAAHFDHCDLVVACVAEWLSLFQSQRPEQAVWLVGATNLDILHSLERFGLSIEVDRLETAIAQIVLPRSLDELCVRHYVNWQVYVPALLKLASIASNYGETYPSVPRRLCSWSSRSYWLLTLI